jgi:hypothetical protein
MAGRNRKKLNAQRIKEMKNTEKVAYNCTKIDCNK